MEKDLFGLDPLEALALVSTAESLCRQERRDDVALPMYHKSLHEICTITDSRIDESEPKRPRFGMVYKSPSGQISEVVVPLTELVKIKVTVALDYVEEFTQMFPDIYKMVAWKKEIAPERVKELMESRVNYYTRP